MRMKTYIEGLIAKYAEQRDEKIKQVTQEYASGIKQLEKLLWLLNKYKGYRKSDLTEECLKEIQSVLCWKNIGYCCSLEKPCPNRNTVMEILGISKEKYVEVKEKVVEQLI